LVDHARQYSTCVNTAVGVKEMVHRIFKSIVPHTNKHNLELTLLRQVNTLQTLRYLADGGVDDRISKASQSLFKEQIIESRLRPLLQIGVLMIVAFQYMMSRKIIKVIDIYIISYCWLFYIIFIIIKCKILIDDFSNDRNLTHSNCTEIKLGSMWNKHKIESAGFISTNLETNGLLKSIM